MRSWTTALALGIGLLTSNVALAVVNPHGKIRDPRWIEPAAVTLSAETLDTRTKAPLADAANQFLSARGGEWEFVIEPRTERALLIQGSGIPWLPGRGNQLRSAPAELSVEALDPMARQLIQDHAALLMPPVGELELDLETSSIRQRGQLISIYYRWKIDGVPVEHARVFVRSNHGNVTQMGAPYVGRASVETRPTIDSAQAIQAALQYSGDDELYRIVEQPELWIQPEALGAQLDYRLIWKFVYQLPQSVARWEVRVDALNSAIVGFRDITNYGRAWGGVYERGVGDGVEVLVPFPAISVSSNGSPFITDSAGFFPFSGGSVASGLNGPIFNTNCQGCTNPSQPNVSTSVGAGRIDFGLGGNDQVGNGLSTPADRNAVYHLTQVRRLGQKWLPALGWLNSTITTNVNIANTCNATYGGNTVNFYRSGGGCNNTGEVSDVMHHEWGHGLDLNTRSGDGATGEATADVVAIHMSHSPLIGPYFRTDGSPVRNLDQFTSGRGFVSIANLSSKCPIIGSLGPLGYEVHCEGEIYGQVAWDLAVALTAKHGEHTGWRESERIFFNALPDSGSYLPGSSLPVYDAYINSDDDDGNLANGTPNGDEIFAAFDAHGMANSNPGSSAACARPAQPTLVVTPSCDQFDLSWSAIPGVDHYEIFRAELRLDSTFFPVAEVAAGTTSYSDLEVSPALDYHYVVMAVDAADCESTVENPIFARLTAQPILGVTAVIDDDIPQGNRSGSADPGETVDLIVDLSNFGDSDGIAVDGTIISSTAGVTLLAANSSWPVIPSGGAATNLDTLRFSTDDSVVTCGDRLAFQFVPTEASGCASQSSYFEVPLGIPTTPIVDSFETDSGWAADAVNSTTPAGAWVRGDPELTTHQPDNDASANGTDCWYTASNPTGDAEVDDIDRGQVVLLSPVYDLSSYGGATLRYSRWWSHSDPGADPGDFFRTEVSDDGGLSWQLVEKLDHNTVIASWTPVSFDLSGLVEMTSQVQIRFIASDGMAVASIVEAAVDDLSIEASLCDATPACFDEPTFAGLQLAAQGTSCAETTLNWSSASSNCLNASIYYNVYRSTTPGFAPDASTLLATGLTTTSFNDSLLEPGQSYHYIVRAFDSRSGEDSNLIAQTIVAPTAPDLVAPIFNGLNGLQTTAGCGGAQLDWSAALESCSLPVVYEVHRSTTPGFTPDAMTLVAQTTGTSYEDLATPGVEYSYIVRAADGAGNDDGNLNRFTASAGITDRVVQLETFESSGGGWSVVAPNDAATGSWEWGDPQGTSQQPEDDATPSGVNAWITGLPASVGGGNNDIDAGTTTLLSASYDSTGLVDPAVGYARWFTNDLGASPGNDPLVVEVSNDNGVSWLPLETINTGLPLAWNKAQVALDPILTSTDQMRFRFTAQDLGAGSLVEAGIDDFAVIDQNEGCNVCATPVNLVGTIAVDRVGDDVVLDWSGDPVVGDRFAIYQLTGVGFTDAIRIGTTDSRTFTHNGALLSDDAFNYRVTAVDSCGNESLRD